MLCSQSGRNWWTRSVGAASKLLIGLFKWSLCLMRNPQWSKASSTPVLSLLLMSCKVALQSQHMAPLPCHPGKAKISLNAFQSALIRWRTALQLCVLPANFFLALSVGNQSKLSCLLKGCSPVAKLCRLQSKMSKIWLKVFSHKTLCSIHAKGMRKFLHWGIPGNATFITSNDSDLSQLYGTPSHQKDSGVRVEQPSSEQALAHSPCPKGPNPSQVVRLPSGTLLLSLQSHSWGKSTAIHSLLTFCFFWSHTSTLDQYKSGHCFALLANFSSSLCAHSCQLYPGGSWHLPKLLLQQLQHHPKVMKFFQHSAGLWEKDLSHWL